MMELFPGLEWKTKYVVLDFEKAFMKAVNTVLPEIEFVLCFFHLSQSIHRHVGTLGLKTILQENSKCEYKWRLRVNMLKALAFVPCEDVSDAFVELSEAFNWGQFEILKDYFEMTYIGIWKLKKGTNGRRPGMERTKPAYPIELWNVFNRTLDGLGRTNNKVEAFNKAFSKSLNQSKPPIWKLLGHFQTEASLVNSKLRHIESNSYKAKPNKRYAVVSKKLQRQTQAYDSNQKMDYLCKCALVLGSA